MSRLLFVVAATAALTVMPTGAGAQDVSVTLSEWKVRAPVDTVAAGTINFQVRNNGQMAHALQVVGPGVEKGTRQVAAKELASLSVVLKPGTYELYCPLAEGSHKQAGMTKTLVVTEATAKKP